MSYYQVPQVSKSALILTRLYCEILWFPVGRRINVLECLFIRCNLVSVSGAYLFLNLLGIILELICMICCTSLYLTFLCSIMDTGKSVCWHFRSVLTVEIYISRKYFLPVKTKLMFLL